MENAFEVWNELKNEYDSLGSRSKSDPKVKRQRTQIGRMQRQVEDYINSIGRQPGDKQDIFNRGGRSSGSSDSGGKWD